MYLLNVSYIRPVEEVAEHHEAHGIWVRKHIAEGHFLLAGPKKSKLGGAILVKSMDKNKLSAILAEDAYVQQDVAEYQIIDFDCKLAGDTLQTVINL